MAEFSFPVCSHDGVAETLDIAVAVSLWQGCLDIQATNIAACVQAIDRFRLEPETVVLLASMLASGTGITVTCASEVVLMEPYWNPFVSAAPTCVCCVMLALCCAVMCMMHALQVHRHGVVIAVLGVPLSRG